MYSPPDMLHSSLQDVVEIKKIQMTTGLLLKTLEDFSFNFKEYSTYHMLTNADVDGRNTRTVRRQRGTSCRASGRTRRHYSVCASCAPCDPTACPTLLGKYCQARLSHSALQVYRTISQKPHSNTKDNSGFKLK